jgi:protein involved in polysaccharide export with SLBB domain
MGIKHLAWAGVLAIALAGAGCTSNFGPVVIEPDPIPPSQVASQIQAGDRIKVLVYGEQSVSGIYEVNPGGSVSLPLAGTIRAAGRTRAELERDITDKFSATITEPKVSIEVIERRPFYVFGEVFRPSQYPYRTGLNVLTAISTAGGLTYRASRTTVLVQHPGETVWREYAMSASVLISPGDLIRVPERYF